MAKKLEEIFIVRLDVGVEPIYPFEDIPCNDRVKPAYDEMRRILEKNKMLDIPIKIMAECYETHNGNYFFELIVKKK